VQQIQSTGGAFAAILAGGSVLSWGNRKGGADSLLFQDRLKCVQQLNATGAAFAAVLADGSVVAWGHEDQGGDSSKVQSRLLKS
jgi:hypothetical protein